MPGTISNASIYHRIQDRLRVLGKTPNAACIEADLGRDAIRDIQRRPRILPRLDTLAALAPVLGTTPEWLAFGRGMDDPARTNDALRVIPVVSWVAASGFADPGHVAMPADGWPLIEVAGLPPGEYIALTVHGNSMNKIAPEYSTIIVRLTDRELVDYGLYIFSGEDGTTFKQYLCSDGPPRLVPRSTGNHKTIFPDGELQIVGRVVRVVTDLYAPDVIRELRNDD